MGKIKVDKDQFAYIVFSYLFDKLLHMDEVSVGNEDFNEIMIKLRPRLLPLSREMYLEQSADLRMKYKLIKKGFRQGSSQQTSIFVIPSGEKAKEVAPGLIKKIIKKVIKAITSSTEISSKEVDYIKEILEDVEEE